MKISVGFVLAALSAIAAANPVTIKRGAAAVTDKDVLNVALTLEHLESAFYKEGLAKYDAAAFQAAGFPQWVRGRFVQIAEHEADHVKFLKDTLGNDAVKACKYDFPYTDPKSWVALSEVLESIGVSAYTGAAQLLTNKDYVTAAAEILSTEARQASWINSSPRPYSGWSGSFETPLTLSEAYSLAAPFIKKCPQSNPTLPVTAYPTIKIVSGDAKPESTITITASDNTSINGPNKYAVFLSGRDKKSRKISNDGDVKIPKGLLGTVYMVVSSTEDAGPNDIIAGPKVLQFEFDSRENLIQQ